MAEVRADSGLTAVGEELRIALIDRYLEGEMPDRASARRRLTGLLTEVVRSGRVRLSAAVALKSDSGSFSP